MRSILILLLLCACGDRDKAADDSSDLPSDSAPVDSADSGDSADPGPDLTASVIFSATWGARTQYGGYASGISNSGWLIASPVDEVAYKIPLDAGQGLTIADAADVWLNASYLSPDDIAPGLEGGWIGFADAGWDRPSTQEEDAVPLAGALRLISEETLAGFFGAYEIAGAAEISVIGAAENAFTGAGLIADLDGDGYTDLFTKQDAYSGLSVAAVFSDVERMSNDFGFEEANLIWETCLFGAADFGPQSPIVFGDDYLGLGCTQDDYRSGYYEIYALPIVGGDLPVAVIEDVAGWYAASPGLGYGACFDARGANELRCVSGDLAEEWSIVSDYTRFGSGVTALLTTDGRELYAFGAQSAVNEKDGTEEGLTFICEGQPRDEEDCTEVPTPSDAGLRYMGAVNDLHEVDGRILLLSTGWQFGTGTGGGAAGWEVE